MNQKTKNTILSATAIALGSAPMFVMAQKSIVPEDADKLLPSGTFTELLSRIMTGLFYLVGIIAVIAFLVAGLLYLTSGGDSDKTDKAKEAMISAIIGIIVALLGLIAINAIERIMGNQASTDGRF